MPMTPREMVKHLKQNGFEVSQAKWFSYNNEEPVYWKNSGGSLSLQDHEKRIGAGNTLKQAGLK